MLECVTCLGAAVAEVLSGIGVKDKNNPVNYCILMTRGDD